MQLKPKETSYIMGQTTLVEQIQNNLYASKLCDTNTQALLYAVLTQYQIQYNQARKQGEQVDEYSITIYEKDLEGFIKELSTAKTIKPKKLLEKKIKSVFTLSNYTNIVEQNKISETQNKYTHFQLFVMEVITEQIPYNILLEQLPKEVIDANKIEDFQAIKAYTFRTTKEGTDYINRMFSSIGTGYSYFLVGLSLTLPTDTAKKVLNFLCKYMNAILAGQWSTGGQVVFTIDEVYSQCGIHSANPKKNKDTLLKALDEVNTALLTHFSITDKEGQPVQIKCKYLKNGEYNYNSWYKADKETHIQFYAHPIEDLDKLSTANNTMKKIVDTANMKDTFKTVKKEAPPKKKSQTTKEMYEIVEQALNGEQVKLDYKLITGWFLYKYDTATGHGHGGQFAQNIGRVKNIAKQFHLEEKYLDLAQYMDEYISKYKKHFTGYPTLADFTTAWKVQEVLDNGGQRRASYHIENDYKHDTRGRRI